MIVVSLSHQDHWIPYLGSMAKKHTLGLWETLENPKGRINYCRGVDPLRNQWWWLEKQHHTCMGWVLKSRNKKSTRNWDWKRPLNCFVSSSLDCLINVCLLTWLALVGLVQSRRDLFDQKCSEKKYRCIFIWPELSLTNITKITKKSKGQWKENCWCTGWFFHWYLDSIAVSLFGGKLLLVHQVCADQWEYCPKSGGQQGSKFQEHI